MTPPVSSALSPSLFAIFKGLVEERVGIHYGPGDVEVFASKLWARARDAGFDSLLDYYYFLKYDADAKGALEALIDALVVNETYFHREADQLHVLCDAVIRPLLAASRGRRARIWCAAASTGEEPYTLAILLDERGLLGDVEILASDVSTRALARAQEASYGPRALRALPDSFRGRYVVVDGERATVDARIREAVTFHRINLLDDEAIARLGTFDAVLCRNVLIYFSDETMVRVVHSLAGRLKPGGFLLVGASESLLRVGTLLSFEERGGCFFYVNKGRST